ncbi:MAG: ABC transporter permease [Candidatus Bipolaricaulota bacterium]
MAFRRKQKADPKAAKPRSLGRDAMRRLLKNRPAVAGGVILLILFLAAIFADFVAPYSYTQGNVRDNYAGPSAEHIMGCDFMGRDIFSRLIYGARISLSAGLVGALTAFVIGVTFGLVAGFIGGKTDNVMMRFVDIMYAFPTLLLIILLMVFFKSSFSVSGVAGGGFRGLLSNIDRATGGMFFIFLGIGLTSWLGMARLVRGMTLSVRNTEYVEAARAIGTSRSRILVRHVLPNVLGPAIVAQALQIPGFILYEAFLSFIGLGVNPPTPSWGMMLSDGYMGMRSHFHLVLWPAVAISVTLFAFNFLGDGIRDAFDPRQTR